MKIGIIGAGGIASKMAATIKAIDGMENYAIASRSLEKAEQFKKQQGFQKAYGSYEELCQDTNVDLVYIATPHSEHYKNMELALKYHKPVLCEKAFTANAKQAEDIISRFETSGVFLTEAIWTRYMPSRKTLDNLLASGLIGEPYLIYASLCYPIKNHARLVDPALAGGALLDVGVYPINFASMAFSSFPTNIYASCTLSETKVDETDTLIFDFPNNKKAVLAASMDGPSDRRGIIYGTKGYIEVININNTERIDVFDPLHNLIQSIKVPFGISGYEWELFACSEALKENKLECPEMTHKDTLKIMKVLDECRRQMGIIYPFEKE
ncbi:MAG: Gfo/Idh/MocA family oxidoreductase [Bacilli bacterium]|jgi:predicted dehydrogenase|nr:Gfo/Idh/MocA family oxidoreductase [Bacilli bacterium]